MVGIGPGVCLPPLLGRPAADDLLAGLRARHCHSLSPHSMTTGVEQAWLNASIHLSWQSLIYPLFTVLSDYFLEVSTGIYSDLVMSFRKPLPRTDMESMRPTRVVVASRMGV